MMNVWIFCSLDKNFVLPASTEFLTDEHWEIGCLTNCNFVQQGVLVAVDLCIWIELTPEGSEIGFFSKSLAYRSLLVKQ